MNFSVCLWRFWRYMLYNDQVLLNFTLFCYPSFQFNKRLLKTCFPGTLLTLGIQRWCWRAWKFSSKRWHETQILGTQWDLQWGFDTLILPLALCFLGPFWKKLYTQGQEQMEKWSTSNIITGQMLNTCKSKVFLVGFSGPQDLALTAKVGLPNPIPLDL